MAAVENHPLASIIEARGAEVIFPPNDAGKVDLQALMRELAKRGINELHVEAGFKLNGSLPREGLVDELLLYLAPSLIGDASRGCSICRRWRTWRRTHLQWRDVRQVGGDLRAVARAT